MVKEICCSPLWSLAEPQMLGNFHALIKFNNDEELKAVEDAVHRLVHRAIALDGTCRNCWHKLPVQQKY